MTFSEVLNSCFDDLTDPRWGPQRQHLLSDILSIALLATLCGFESFEDMQFYGEERYDWLSTFMKLPSGIPSESTFRRVISCLDQGEFESALVRITKYLAVLIASVDEGENKDPQVIPIDGKTARRSFKAKSDQGHLLGALHSVAAYDFSSGLVLGSVAVPDKSNEITAIPELLSLVSIEGAIVTIDAMGCQKKNSQEVRRRGADYIFALKKNHGELFNSVKALFSTLPPLHDVSNKLVHHEVDKGHGRLEIRSCLAMEKGDLWGDSYEWEDFTTIIMVEATRETEKRTETSRRYYIASIPADSALASYAIRTHWSIENQLHWVLDTTFREDHSRGRTKNQQKNLAILRRICMNILKTDKNKKLTMKRRRLKAAMGTEYIEQMLAQSTV